MGKVKSSDVLALDKSEQKKVAKQTKKLKRSITDGKIVIRNQRKSKNATIAQSRGLVYIAHIPHGFFETEMRNYFKQFGVITNVQVCRSRKNGNSKGYGYVEFMHPEVAKIAAETMNNYLMFKKRIVAEYVPYEKRPRGLFKGKRITANNCSAKIRRDKQMLVNSSVDPATHFKRSKARLLNLNKKMQRLQNAGIESNVQPTDVPEAVNQENPTEKEGAPATHQQDPYDSDIEVRIPLKRSRKSVQSTGTKSSGKKSKSSVKSKPSKKSIETTESNRVLLAKSLDSVKTLLSNKASTKSATIRSVPSIKKVNKATSSPKFRKGKGAGKGERKLQGITKKAANKPKVLSPDILKKIARELIRKKGHSLLNFTGTQKKKSGKKKDKVEKDK